MVTNLSTFAQVQNCFICLARRNGCPYGCPARRLCTQWEGALCWESALLSEVSSQQVMNWVKLQTSSLQNKKAGLSGPQGTVVLTRGSLSGTYIQEPRRAGTSQWAGVWGWILHLQQCPTAPGFCILRKAAPANLAVLAMSWDHWGICPRLKQLN